MMAVVITVLALGIIIGGILVLKKSAKSFTLTPEQLTKIKKRNELLAKEEEQENER